MLRPMPAPEHLTTALRAHTALALVIAGHGSTAEWSDLADAANVVEALVQLGKSAEREAVYRTMQILADARAAQRETGYLTLTDAEPVKRVVSAYDLAMQRMARETIAQAYQIVLSMIADARAPGSGCEVVE